MGLSLIPAALLLIIVLTTNPTVQDEKSVSKSSAPVHSKKTVAEKPYTAVESPAGDDFDYQAIFSYIKTKFKSIGDDDAHDISQNLVNYGKEYNLDPKFAAAVIARESSFNKEAVSSTGAKGLGQIKDFNYPSLGISDPFNITENVKGTTRYLKEMLTNWHKTKESYDKKKNESTESSFQELDYVDKVKLSLASYYKGFTAVKNENGELDEKTSGYVNDILKFYDEISSIRTSIEKENYTQN